MAYFVAVLQQIRAGAPVIRFTRGCFKGVGMLDGWLESTLVALRERQAPIEVFQYSCAGLMEKELRELLVALRRGPHLKELSLRGTWMGDGHVEVLRGLVPRFTGLRVLELSETHLDARLMQLLGPAVSRVPCLHLSNNPCLGDAGLEVVFRARDRVELEFSNCGVTGASVGALRRLMLEATRLRSLVFFTSSLSSTEIARLLPHLRQLRRFEFSSSDLRPVRSTSLAENLWLEITSIEGMRDVCARNREARLACERVAMALVASASTGKRQLPRELLLAMARYTRSTEKDPVWQQRKRVKRKNF